MRKAALARSRFIKSDDLYKSGFLELRASATSDTLTVERGAAHVDEPNCTISTFHCEREKNWKGHARRQQNKK
jgi:hypothetical protein